MTRTLGWLLFGLYVVFSILLPAGSIFGLNVKILVFVPLTILGVTILAQAENPLRQFGFMALVTATATLWVIPSLLNPYYALLSLSQYKDVLTTLVGCLFIRLFTANAVERSRFIRLCLYTVAFGGLIKLGIFLYTLRTGTSVANIVDQISAAFGVKLMSIDIDGVGGRLQFPSDNVLPICIFAIFGLRKRLKIHAWASLLMVVLFVVSSMYTFSRFIWASSALAACLGMLISGKDKMRYAYLGLISAALLYSLPVLTVLFELRFSSDLATASDAERIWQAAWLKEFFWRSPVFGHGMGSYSLQYLRSYDLPYAYEVQILALFGEFGIVGMTLFALLMFNYYRKAFSFPRGIRKYQIAVLLLLADFIAAGFFNPCLLVSLSAVSYGLVFALAELGTTDWREKAERETPVFLGLPPAAGVPRPLQGAT